MCPGLAWLLLAGLLSLSSADPCVNTTGCSGCGGSAISCVALGLTDFPTIPAEDAALVESLDLSYNFLSAIIAEDLQHFTRLEELKVTNNDITHIEEGSFSNTLELSMLSLSNNPLHCDCGLRWLLELLVTSLTMETGGMCGSPSQLAGSPLSNLTLSQLVCACSPECGQNSSCNEMFGRCECDPGYRGNNCSQVCFSGRFGLNCSETCACGTGSCHHVTGDCICPPGYLGTNCSHDCTGAPDCALLGRETCSLDTPENTCGVCTIQPAGSRAEHDNSSCMTETSSVTVMTPHTSTPVAAPSSTAYHSLYSSQTSPSGSPGSYHSLYSSQASPSGSPGSYHSLYSSQAEPSGSPRPRVTSEDLLITTSELIILLSCLALLVVSLLLLATGTLLLLSWRNSTQRKMRIGPLSPVAYASPQKEDL